MNTYIWTICICHLIFWLMCMQPALNSHLDDTVISVCLQHNRLLLKNLGNVQILCKTEHDICAPLKVKGQYQSITKSSGTKCTTTEKRITTEYEMTLLPDLREQNNISPKYWLQELSSINYKTVLLTLQWSSCSICHKVSADVAVQRNLTATLVFSEPDCWAAADKLVY